MRGKLRYLMIATTALTVLGTAAAQAAPQQEDQRLRKAVTATNIFKHLRALDTIGRQNDGNRAAATPGYAASVAYVSGLLKNAGYTVTTQSFPFPFFEETSPAELARLSPQPNTFVVGTDFAIMSYSGSGDVSGRVVPIDVDLPPVPLPASSTSGCEPADFPSPPGPDSIALLQRGTCTFGIKANNAEAAGYAAAIIFNEGQEGRTDLLLGTLGEPISIPVVGATFAVGEELAELAQTGPVTARLATETISENRVTQNVIADSPGGRPFRTIVVGAHLDSVPAGPGINDNGSGTAANLEIALQIAKLNLTPRNRLRFAFWGAEELGLFGSNYYVANLSPAKQAQIDLNLNFDMVGSPNFARLVYDGDGSEFGLVGPDGSDEIEAALVKFFRSRGLATQPTAFDGRSDYFAFISAGIPAGGLFSGAEAIKTAEQEGLFGGEAGVALDPCYHQACDTIANPSRVAIDQFSDAMADVIWEYAIRAKALPRPDAKAKARAASMVDRFDYRGGHAIR